MESQPLKVDLYTSVALELLLEDGELERMYVTVVEDALSDLKHGLLGLSTPLARTIVGQQAGVRLAYRAGDIKAVRILEVRPLDESVDLGAGARRREEAAQAIQAIARRNLEAFAASYTGKWGDYDPGAVK